MGEGDRTPMNKELNQTSYFASRILRITASLILGVLLTLPFGAFAEEAPEPVVITEETIAETPVVQTVQAGTTDNTPVVTQTTFSTSTPSNIPPTPPPSGTASSTPNLNPEPNPSTGSTTPETTASSTPPSQIEGSNASTTPNLIPDPNANNGTTTPETTASTTDTSTLGPLAVPDPNVNTDNSTTTVAIINMNDINIKTHSTSTAATGLNGVKAGSDIKDAMLVAGDVNVYANVLTVANVNLVNSEIVEMNDTFNKLSADLYFNQTEMSAGEKTQNLVSPICSSSASSCKSITTFKISNSNVASVENNVVLNGISGGNEFDSGGDVKNSSITAGSVNAVVNVLNIINTNAVNSR